MTGISRGSSHSVRATRGAVIALATASLAFGTGLPAFAGASTPTGRPAAGSASSITELIVAYEPGVPPTEAPGVATGASVVTTADLGPGAPIGFGMRTVRLGTTVDAATAEQIAAELESSPGVAFAEPNGTVTLAETVIQPSAPWGLDRIDQAALPIDGTYRYPGDSTGSGVNAYVIDSGIRSTHAELAGRVASGFSGIADANGTEDCLGHGTHVAGIIGGTTYGVAKQATVVPVRVFGCTGSTTLSIIIAGIDWTVSNHQSGVPAVANMSFRSGGSAALDTAVNALISDGVTVVAASGNDAVDACQISPARVPDAITVNASGDDLATGSGVAADVAASFSNFGGCTDLYAPGVGITSSWYSSNTATAVLSGTSMAAPHAAGAAARILDANPDYTPAQVWAAMSAVSTPIAFPRGGGDPDRLLFATPGVAATVPGAPTDTSVTSADQSASVTWQAPLSNGGSALTSYTARAWDSVSGGGFGSRTCTTTDGLSLGCTINGLTNGTTYYVDVIASNAAGNSGPSSPRVEARPVGTGAPSQPRSTSSSPADQSLLITWQAPSSSGGSAISAYTATAWSAEAGGTAQGTCAASPVGELGCAITGLVNGTAYYVDVTATNSSGTSPPSSPRMRTVPATVPGAPQALTAAAADASTLVSWQAPASNGGSALTSYTARAWTAASEGGIVGSCQPTPATALSCTISGLVNGTTYHVDASAASAAGSGPASTPRVAVTPLAPLPPPASGGGGSSGSSGADSGGGGGSIWKVVEVRPAFGSTTGGTRVLVLGWGFTGATSVSIGGVTAPGFTFINDATLEIITPPGTPGWQELRVWLPGGSVPATYEYRVDSATAAPDTSTGSGTPGASPAGPTASAVAYIGPPANAVVRPAPAAASQAGVRPFRRALTRGPTTAPRLVSPAGRIIRLGLTGLPRTTALIAEVRVNGRYYALGKVRSTKNGTAVLPAFQPTRAGSYPVRVVARGTRGYYLTVIVPRG